MIRRTTFVSYHHADEREVRRFVDDFSDVIIPRGIGGGVTDDDNFIGNPRSSTDYVLRKIREFYLAKSTVTVVMLGKCTWARKYVDWEIAASLRDDPTNGRSGLLGIALPSVGESVKLPIRLKDNRPAKLTGYARWYRYPSSSRQLSSWLQDAYDARTERAHLIASPRRDLKVKNSPC